jgi:hypothetical protein
MTAAVPPSKRAEWRQWAQQAIDGDETAIEAATEAVLAALIAGYSVEDAMLAGRAAAAAPASPGVPASGGAPGTAALPASDRTYLRGRVAAMRQRNELMGSQYGSVWNFRVEESLDAQGRPQPPVAIEMRGLSISGSVADGDWIEIEGHDKPGKLRRVRRLRNISMNAPVVAEGGGASASGKAIVRAGGVIVRAVLTVVVIVIATGIALSVISSIRG